MTSHHEHADQDGYDECAAAAGCGCHPHDSPGSYGQRGSACLDLERVEDAPIHACGWNGITESAEDAVDVVVRVHR
jgi:hypothetical protein